MLGRLDAVLLRQLQHLTACAAAMPPSAPSLAVEDKGEQQVTTGNAPMQVDAAEPASNVDPVKLTEDAAQAAEVAAPSPAAVTASHPTRGSWRTL